MATLSVLMPVYNEARTLRTIIGQVLAAPVELDIEIVAVDDASGDGSAAVLEELAAADPRIKVIRHPVNRGKGAALRTAIGHMSGDLAIVQDADLEYDPADYPRVLRPLLDGRADAVFGSRFAAAGERRVLFFWHSLGNKLLTALSNMVNDLNLTDMETGYKAVRGDLLRRLRLTSDRFGIEPEITARLAQWGARIYEVPISYHGRTYAEGKHIGWRDGLQALWLVLKFGFLDTRFTDEGSHRAREALGRARRYRRWQLSQFGDHLGQEVLEIGAGPGHITSQLLDRARLVAVDSSPIYIEGLRRRFGHMDNVSFAVADPNHPSFAERVTGSGFDTVVCVTELQRSPDPGLVVRNAAVLLAPGGCLLVQVPADPRVTTTLDRALGHRHRFDLAEVAPLLAEAGLTVELVRPFNRLGRRLWQAMGRADRGAVSTFEAVAADWAVPVARLVERRLTTPGLSIVAVARKPIEAREPSVKV